jgi:hypothetical protein
MAISPENKARLLLVTHEAAAALVEDMTYIRETLARADRITPGELRRLSATLRRLLIDNDLRSIAPPRIGSLSLLVPDNDAIYTAARKQPVRMFESGGIHIFNNEFRALLAGYNGGIDLGTGFDKSKTILVSQDGFLNQKVLAHNNNWITRRQVIKYVANTSAGAHSKSTSVRSKKPEDYEIILSVLRKALRFTKNGDKGLKIDVDWAAYGGNASATFVWTPTSINSVLVELLCAAHFLAQSPDIHSLELEIHKEFGFPQFAADNVV